MDGNISTGEKVRSAYHDAMRASISCIKNIMAARRCPSREPYMLLVVSPPVFLAKFLKQCQRFGIHQSPGPPSRNHAALDKNPFDIHLDTCRILRWCFPQHPGQRLVDVTAIIRCASMPSIGWTHGSLWPSVRRVIHIPLNIHQAFLAEPHFLGKGVAGLKHGQRDIRNRVDGEAQGLGEFEIGSTQEIGHIARRWLLVVGHCGVEVEDSGGDGSGFGDRAAVANTERFHSGAGVAGGKGRAIVGRIIRKQDEVEGWRWVVVLCDGCTHQGERCRKEAGEFHVLVEDVGWS